MATLDRKLICPRVPNFIRTEDGAVIPVSKLPDDALRDLAAEWLEALRKRAAEQGVFEGSDCGGAIGPRVRTP